MQKRKLQLDKELVTQDSNRMYFEGGTNYLACTMGCTIHCFTWTCPATQTCGVDYGCDTNGCGGGGGGGTSVDGIPGTCDPTV